MSAMIVCTVNSVTRVASHISGNYLLHWMAMYWLRTELS